MQLSSSLNLDLAGGAVVLLALVVAVIIVVVAFANAKDPGTRKVYTLRETMGSAQWDFTKSWASTLTVVGALLGTLLGAVKNAPPQYILLNFFFVLLAVAAPLVCNFGGRMEAFGASRIERDVSRIRGLAWTITHPNQSEPPTPPAQSTYLYQSYIVGFLAACTLTLWAVIGEIVTLTLLLGVLPGFMSGDIFLILVQALFLLTAVVVGYYGWRTIPMTLQAQVSHQEAAKAERIRYLMIDRAMELEEATNRVDESPRLPQPSWSLL